MIRISSGGYSGRRIAWRSNGLPLEQDLQQPLADGAVIAVLDRTKWHL